MVGRRQWFGWLTLTALFATLGISFVAEASSRVALGRRASILQRAKGYVGLPSLRKTTRKYPDDCGGFVRASYAAAGLTVLPEQGRAGENSVTAIYRRARDNRALHWKRPKPGDLVFFRETYDRNGDGRRNDGLTHVGVVESVDRSGTITFLHRMGKGILRSRMNLSQKTRFMDGKGKVWNDYVRRAERGGRGYLAGELFAGFASTDGFSG